MKPGLGLHMSGAAGGAETDATMQINTRAMLAVECMAWLRSCSRLRPGKTLWIATSIQRSVSYTETLLATLREAGLVAAKKGAGGGYYLVKPPDETSIAEILSAFDEPAVDVPPPPLSPGCWDTAYQPAIDILCSNVQAHAQQFLATVSLADIGRDEPAEHGSHSETYRRNRFLATQTGG